MIFSRRLVPLALALVAAAAHGQEKGMPVHEWGYGGKLGPQHWGALKSEYASCAKGRTQSPIDIRNAVPGELAPIEFDYHATPLRIVDNGHTIQINYGAGSSISVAGRRYDLVQFHFHHPSEERINGKSYPMVAHLVHRNGEGALAVVAVLLKQGARNKTIETLWANLPDEKEMEHVVQPVLINAADLLPRQHGYYTFAGSLTTPPCSEGVTWFVLKNPVEVSQEEVARFGKIYKSNARPVQALNGRIVKVSK